MLDCELNPAELHVNESPPVKCSFNYKDRPNSPNTVLKHLPSFATLSTESDSDQDSNSELDLVPAASVPAAVQCVYSLFDAVPLVNTAVDTIDEYCSSLVTRYNLEDNFYVYDLATVARLYDAWCKLLPRVTPFYAVKCNTDRALLSMLSRLGAGFDCASGPEIQAVLELGVPAEKIVFANACKTPRCIKQAAMKSVNLTTYDSESELYKLARLHPDTEVLLRIRADDPDARCQLGNKYGAEPEEWQKLLEAAVQLNLKVAGISFHVGSGATNPAAFGEAIAMAREAFDLGLSLGCDMHTLDIGGGFCGGKFSTGGTVDLGGVPAAVNSALDKYFPASSGVRVISEPGRYFAEAAVTYACFVFGSRERFDKEGRRVMDYWITDGLYGAMNSVLYDHAVLSARVLRSPHLPAVTEGTMWPSNVFGPTCDGLDVVLKEYELPELRVGDWLVFPNMGAYTSVGACNFNGFDVVNGKIFYVNSKRA